MVSEEKPHINGSLSAGLIAAIATAATLGAILSVIYPDIGNLLSGSTYVSGGIIYDAIYVILTLETDVLYLFGGGIITFGGILVIIHFIQVKTKNPFEPSHSTHYLSGYLTLSLNFFIGAEIIRTVAVRSYQEFALLILVIISRGLFSLILYLERRWQGNSETE
jgi:uncharacterized membrane protein